LCKYCFYIYGITFLYFHLSLSLSLSLKIFYENFLICELYHKRYTFLRKVYWNSLGILMHQQDYTPKFRDPIHHAWTFHFCHYRVSHYQIFYSAGTRVYIQNIQETCHSWILTLFFVTLFTCIFFSFCFTIYHTLLEKSETCNIDIFEH